MFALWSSLKHKPIKYRDPIKKMNHLTHLPWREFVACEHPCHPIQTKTMSPNMSMLNLSRLGAIICWFLINWKYHFFLFFLGGGSIDYLQYLCWMNEMYAHFSTRVEYIYQERWMNSLCSCMKTWRWSTSYTQAFDGKFYKYYAMSQDKSSSTLPQCP